MILTRKLQLKVLDKKDWIYLNDLNKKVFKAYNNAVNTHYFSELFKDKILLTDKELKEENEKIDNKLKNIMEEKKKIPKEETTKIDKLWEKEKKLYKKKNSLSGEAIQKLSDLYGGVSIKNKGYQIITKEFPEIPSYIRTCINADVRSNFVSDIGKIKRGEISVRTYRKGVPIPFMASAGKFILKKENINFRWIKNIEFEIYFGRDKSSRRVEVERIISGEYKMSDSRIQIKNRKIFLLLALNISEQKHKQKKDVTVGIDLGIVFPAYISTNSGIQRQHIGSKDDLFKFRIQIQQRRKRLQRDIKSVHGGKGREKKLKALERLRQKERNYVRTYNHYISREIINFAVLHKAAKIMMEDLSGFGKNKEKGDIILRNWSYFELQSMIEYKAELNNIKVVKIKPEYTSQHCAICGKKGNRENQKDFICLNKECENFSNKVNADYNAAMNIARGGIKK